MYLLFAKFGTSVIDERNANDHKIYIFLFAKKVWGLLRYFMYDNENIEESTQQVDKYTYQLRIKRVDSFLLWKSLERTLNQRDWLP